MTLHRGNTTTYRSVRIIGTAFKRKEEEAEKINFDCLTFGYKGREL
jgi:hypothetical protein